MQLSTLLTPNSSSQTLLFDAKSKYVMLSAFLVKLRLSRSLRDQQLCQFNHNMYFSDSEISQWHQFKIVIVIFISNCHVCLYVGRFWQNSRQNSNIHRNGVYKTQSSVLYTLILIKIHNYGYFVFHSITFEMLI